MSLKLYVYDFLFLSSDINFKIDDKANIQEVDNTQISKEIPMLVRRRLTPAGRFAVGSTLNILKSISDIKFCSSIVYASRTGETKRSLVLLQKFLLDEPSSPTDFAVSVHNANVGIASIVSNFHGETIAISAKDKTLYNAFIESFVILKSIKDKAIVLSLYEEDLKDQSFMDLSKDKELFGPFAITLCLSLDSEFLSKKPLFSIDLLLPGEKIEKDLSAENSLILDDNITLNAYEYFKQLKKL